MMFDVGEKIGETIDDHVIGKDFELNGRRPHEAKGAPIPLRDLRHGLLVTHQRQEVASIGNGGRLKRRPRMANNRLERLIQQLPITQ